MKITFLTDSLGSGGKERQLVYLIETLANEYKIQLICFNENIFYKKIFKLPIEIIAINKNDRYKLQKLVNIYLILKRFQPDIIHSWGYLPHIISLPYILLFKRRVRIINGCRRSGGTILDTLRSRLIKKLSYITSDMIISNSKQGLAVENLDKLRKSKVIYNGIDFNNITKKVKIKKDNKLESLFKFDFHVVIIGRFTLVKDYQTFIKAAKLVLKENRNIGFYLIGDGKNRNKIENLAGRWKDRNIFFLGRRDDVFDLLQNMDIGVLLTNIKDKLAEGISNVIMEYMAFGMPVIATNAGGTPEIVEDEKSGYLVPAFDYNEVSNKLKYLMEKPDLIKKMGEKGKNILKQKFSMEKMINSYRLVYNNINKVYN